MKGNRGNGRMVIIGLDGVPYRVIKHLTSSGVMKNLAQVIEDGVFRKMASTIPEISSIAWSSVITGKNAGEHGIYGFVDLSPGTYRLQFPNYYNLKASPFWSNGKETVSIIINVPGTYPVKELNGVLISGFVALDIKRAVYPPEMLPRLQEMGYQVDVDSGKAHKSMDLFMKDLDHTLKSRIKAYRFLWESREWDNFMLVFTGTDRLFHFLWNAYEDEGHKYHDLVLDHFRQIDEAIGEIADQLREEDGLLLLSDHGFEALDSEVNINYCLSENGFFDLKQGTKASLTNMEPRTRAFALDPSRIYLNMKDKYPGGSVRPEEREGIIDELVSLFESLEMDGKKVIRRICRGEDIYHGPYADRAPDLVLLSQSGFNLKANVKTDSLFSKGVFTGKHSQDDAFLVVKGSQNDSVVPEVPTVEDIVSIKNQLV